MKSAKCMLALALATTVVAEKKPVEKITKLLTDMKQELETEGEADEKVNKKMTCWCNDEETAKTAAIKAGNEAIPELGAKIDANLFEATTLETEIEAEEETRKEAQESIKTATTQHEKAIKEGDAKQEEMRNYIKALEKAAKKLKKGPGSQLEKKASFLASKKEVQETARIVDNLQAKYSSSLLAAYTPRQQKLVLAALRSDIPSSDKTQVDPSDEIEAIIDEMRVTFVRDLGSSEDMEADKKTTFTELRAAKGQEINAMSDQILAKRTQKATAEENAAINKQDRRTQKKNLKINEKILKDVRIRCKQHKEEYDTRTNLRNKEVTAVAEAIAILSTDAAKHVFDKTFEAKEKPASFLQTASFSAAKVERQRKAIQKFAEVVGGLASKVQNKRLVSLAKAALIQSSSKAALDGFTKVKEAIDTYRQEVKDKKAYETDKNEKCKQRKNKNSDETTKYSRDKADAEAIVEQLSASIETLTKEIKEKEEAIEKLEKDVKEADEERKEQNENFKKTMAENKETQEVLNNALKVLQEEYEKTNDLALAQDAQKPPEVSKPDTDGFKEMNPNKQSSTVIGMLKQVLRDAESLGLETEKGEKQAETDYLDYKADSTTELATLKADVEGKTGAKAKAEEGKLAAEDDVKSASDTLDSLAATLKAIKEDCDFLQNNFQTRMQAYDQEMDALVQAKNILSGAIVKEA